MDGLDLLSARCKRQNEQLVAAASFLADADAQAWGRLRRVLFWVLVCIWSLAFSEGSIVFLVRRLTARVVVHMSQVLARWRRGYAEGDALPAPQGLGNLGSALEQDAAAF